MPSKQQNKIYVAAAMLLIAIGVARFGREQADFDAVLWKSNREQSSKTTRYGLSKSLVNHLNSNRPSRNEVLDLLGPPDREVSDSFFQYDLGRNSSIPLFPRDQWWLSISFKNGRFVEARRNAD